MSFSPNSSRVRQTIDENYANKKRASSMKWILVNLVFLFIFVYDLCSKCAGYTSLLHYVELVCAAVLAANVAQHARRLLPGTTHVPAPGTLNSSRAQFDTSILSRSASSSDSLAFNSSLELSDADLSISSSRVWRRTGTAGGSPTSPSPPRPAGGVGEGEGRDEFIADQDSLTQYLKEYEESHASPESAATPGGWGAGGWETGAGAGGYSSMSPRTHVYHIASLPSELPGSESMGGAAGGALWRRVRLDPARLDTLLLNLRTWIHVTILERLVREMASLDDTLARAGLHDVKLGQVSLDRLRAACGSTGGGAAGSGAGAMLEGLLPFLQVCSDQQYLVQRLRELAVGGCLSNYSWNGGGARFSPSLPSPPPDAALLARLLAAYLWSLHPAPRPPCPAPLLVTSPPPPPRREPAIMCVKDYPPHYVLLLDDETVEVSVGHNNLLHTLLVLVAWGARRQPPALYRLSLASHALNLLWVVQQ